jgi:hypothetical protein
VKKLVKLGDMFPGKCVCINLVYFVPTKEFNLYFEATVFGWSAIKEGWSNFAQYLVARGLGEMFINTDDGKVVRMGLVDDKITRIDEPVLQEDSKFLQDADKGDKGRTFQLDRFHATQSSMMNLFELCPTADKYLGSQMIAYLAMAVESSAKDNNYRQELIKLVEDDACTEENMLAFAARCEERHARRYVAASVESNGYSIMGQAAEKPGDPNSLYTVGLSQFGEGYEVYIIEDFPAFDMGLLMTEVTQCVVDGLKVDEINARLKESKRYKKKRPRLVRSRNVRVEEVFLHRVREKFDTYRLMLDV